MSARLGKLVGLSVLCAFSVAPRATEVSGRVFMPDGKPAVGAPVWLLRATCVVSETRTDASGAFQFNAPRAGSAIVAHPRGAAIVWATLWGQGGGCFALHARRPASVRGTVLGPDGKPVAGAAVTLVALNSGSQNTPLFNRVDALTVADLLPGTGARTGMDGAFTVGGIPDNATAYLQIAAKHLAFVAGMGQFAYSQNYGWTPAGGDSMQVRAGDGQVTVRLDPVATIRGRVMFNGKPQVGAVVTVGYPEMRHYNLTAVTDRAGRYTVEVAPKSYPASAEAADGLLSEPMTCTVQSGDVEEADFELRRTATVEGRIPLNGSQPEDWYAGASQAGDGTYRMNASPGVSVKVTIGANGRFSFHVPAGRWAIYGSSSQWALSGKFTISPDQVGQVVKVQLTVAPRKRTTVRVCDEQGRPVRGAMVGAAFSEQTDSNGEVPLDFVRPDETIYAASADLTHFGSGQLGKSSDAVPITLKPGAPISGRVVDGAGKPIADVSCQVEVEGPPPAKGFPPSQRSWFVAETNADGRYRFCLPQGTRYDLTVVKPGWGVERTSAADVAAGGVQAADSRLEPNDRVAVGTVVDEQGKPLAGVLVEARWQWYDNSGPSEEVFGTTDANGAFRIGGLPRKQRVQVYVAQTWEFVGKSDYAEHPNLSHLKLVAARKKRPEPIEFVAGTPLLSDDDVDWIQSKATVGTSNYSLLFVTAYDSSCEWNLAWVNSRRRLDPRGPTIVVFDSALPLDELKAYVASRHVEGPVARVKETANLGWGGNGLFRRFRVHYVPSWGAVDRAGRPTEVASAFGISEERPPSSPFLMHYGVVTDGSAVPQTEAEPTGLATPLPKAIVGARLYSIGIGGSSRTVALGTMEGRPAMAFDVRGAGDAAKFEIVPLAERSGALVGTITATQIGQDTPLLGHYEVEVINWNTPGEKVRLKSLGAQVSEVAIGDKRYFCTVREAAAMHGFTAPDAASWRSGDLSFSLPLEGSLAIGRAVYLVGVDLREQKVTVMPAPEIISVAYDGDEFHVDGNACGTHWNIDGRAGKAKMPKQLYVQNGSLSRKDADGKEWALSFMGSVEQAQTATPWDFRSLRGELTANASGGTVEFKLKITAPMGMTACLVTTPSGVRREPVIEVLDAAGKVIAVFKPQWFGQPVKWNIVGAPARARLKADFGPFKVESVDVPIVLGESEATSPKSGR